MVKKGEPFIFTFKLSIPIYWNPIVYNFEPTQNLAFSFNSILIPVFHGGEIGN